MPHKRKRNEMIPTERIGMVVLLLADNREQRYTTADIARYAEISHAGAWAMLTRLSRKLPLTCDPDGWYMLSSTDG